MTDAVDVARADSAAEAAGRRTGVSLRDVVNPRAARKLAYVLLALCVVMSVLVDLGWAFANDTFSYDFAGTLWDPGVAILDGRSPYPPPVVSEVDVGNPGYYPPLLLVLVAPLTLLPWAVGAVAWTALLALSLVAAIYLLGVRDARCYIVALVAAPAVDGLVWGNATLLLVPLVALAWRWRQHLHRSGAVVGLVIAIKLFLWPLLFWQLGTRRYRAVGTAVAVAAAGVVVPWALIGFDGFRSYPDLLRVARDIYALHSYSVATMLGALGVETEPATWIGLALGSAIAVLAFIAGRRHNDEASLSLAILASLVASPIVWEHYFALLLIPVAIALPRFSGLWLILPLFYFSRSLPAPPADTAPGGAACCPPDSVPLNSWLLSHAPPALWPAVGHFVLATAVIAVCVRAVNRPWNARRLPASADDREP